MEGFKLFPTADAHEHDNDTHSEANKPGEEIADMITSLSQIVIGGGAREDSNDSKYEQ